MRDYTVVSIVVKNGKVDNLMVSEKETIGVEHAESMVNNYKDEVFDQIVVYKHYKKDNMNEKIFEFLPEDTRA